MCQCLPSPTKPSDHENVLMMNEQTCCTCATILSTALPSYDEKSKSSLAANRHLECCGRVICRTCISKNERFTYYCPFCQISTKPSSLPSHGLREPPAYAPPNTSKPEPSSTPDDSLPAYSAIDQRNGSHEKEQGHSVDTLHFLDPSQDTIPSLALRYKVPQYALRQKNNLFADHLLAARKKILLAGEY